MGKETSKLVMALKGRLFIAKRTWTDQRHYELFCWESLADMEANQNDKGL
jgi:hypothetical protein